MLLMFKPHRMTLPSIPKGYVSGGQTSVIVPLLTLSRFLPKPTRL
jgi:hypothetical protein